MKTNTSFFTVIFMIILLSINSCVEPFNIETETFENALVVEANITNEFKYHEINLSRTFKLDKTSPLKEQKALVSISDDAQNIFTFKEVTQGKYISEEQFSAQPNTFYKLSITTSKGESYTTNPTELSSSTHIDNLYAEKQVDNLGNDNISIFVDSFDPTGASKYYRYEFEETYKIIAPKWTSKDLNIPVYKPPYSIVKVPKTKEELICYKTVYSNAIIQAETSEYSENKIEKYPVRILSKNNPKISHRYSILVKQYVQSLDSYLFYKTTNKLSGSESLFSQNQPGLINGNIFSLDNPNEKVIGFFDVSTVSKKRIYLNYPDFFPNQPIPPYFSDCTSFAPSNEPRRGGQPSLLATLIKNASIKYLKDYNGENEDEGGGGGNGENIGESAEPGPYSVVWAACGDCTKLGINIKPEFWVD